MPKNDLYSAIMQFFNDRAGDSYSLKDLDAFIRPGKHGHKQLLKDVNTLVSEGKLTRQGKRYTLPNTPKPTRFKDAEIEISPKPRPPRPTREKQLSGTFDAGSLARNYSFAFVNTPEGDVLVNAEDTAGAMHGDTVLVDVSYRGPKLRGRVVKVEKRARTQFTGRIEHFGRQKVLVPDVPRITMNFTVIDDMHAAPDDKVLLEVSNWGGPGVAPAGKVVQIMGKCGEPATELAAIMQHFNLPSEFPAQVMDFVNALPDAMQDDDYRGREDFRSLVTFTIDPVSARDYDDALSWIASTDGYDLYVHIADVAHYVPTESPVFKEAFQRGNSFYFPKKVIPMLPEKLSNRLCSLRPQEDKPVLTVITSFDHDYRVVKQRLARGVINSDARLTYEEVDALLEGKDTDIEPVVGTALKGLEEFSSAWNDQRKRQGCLFLDLPEAEYVYNDEGVLTDIQRSRETPSHRLVENCMLVANVYTARLLTRQTRAALYRIHEAPDPQDLTRLKNLLKYYGFNLTVNDKPATALQKILADIARRQLSRVFDRIVLRSLKKARYGAERLGHFGLGEELYTHFTSPIRRLCDLMVHHQLVALLNTEQQPFSFFQLKKAGQVASERELLADESEREMQKRQSLLLMHDHLGAEYQAVVTGVYNDRLLVELDEIFAFGVIPLRWLPGGEYQYDDRGKAIKNTRGQSVYRLADELRVQVAQVSDEVYLRPLERKAGVTVTLGEPRRYKDKKTTVRSWDKKGSNEKFRRSKKS